MIVLLFYYIHIKSHFQFINASGAESISKSNKSNSELNSMKVVRVFFLHLLFTLAG